MLDQLVLERDWLYSPIYDGLTWIGALVVAAVAAGRERPEDPVPGRGCGSPLGSRGDRGAGFSPLGLILLGLASSSSWSYRWGLGPWSPRCSAP